MQCKRTCVAWVKIIDNLERVDSKGSVCFHLMLLHIAKEEIFLLSLLFLVVFVFYSVDVVRCV